MKRSRRGGRRPQHAGGGHNNNGGGGHNPNRTFDSSGPEVKIRGSAANVYEKYLQLARDANSSGDRVMAENYLQHAEHYYRLIMAYQSSVQPQQGQGGGQPYGQGQPQHQQGQASQYNASPYRNAHPPGAGPQPVMEANGNALENRNGNGSSIAADSSQDDNYNEEDNGRYD